MIMNPYRIGRGPGYQRPPQVSHGRAPVKIMLLLNIVKTREEREEEDKQRGSGNCRKGDTHVRGGTLNIETITGRGRELADLMERRNVNIVCLQETKWKGSKARNIGGGCKLFYNEANRKKMR